MKQKAYRGEKESRGELLGARLADHTSLYSSGSDPRKSGAAIQCCSSLRADDRFQSFAEQSRPGRVCGERIQRKID